MYKGSNYITGLGRDRLLAMFEQTDFIALAKARDSKGKIPITRNILQVISQSRQPDEIQ